MADVIGALASYLVIRPAPHVQTFFHEFVNLLPLLGSYRCYGCVSNPNELWLLGMVGLSHRYFPRFLERPFFCAATRLPNDPLLRPPPNAGEYRGVAASPASCVLLLVARPRYKISIVWVAPFLLELTALLPESTFFEAFAISQFLRSIPSFKRKRLS